MHNDRKYVTIHLSSPSKCLNRGSTEGLVLINQYPDLVTTGMTYIPEVTE